MRNSPIDVARIREEEFPEISRSGVVYLNNAAIGPLPARTVKTLNTWAAHRAKPWTVSDHADVFPALAQVRDRCARVIGANTDEIALTPNTSYGISLAANALPLKPDDVVLIAEREFPSIVYAWRAAARTKGFQVNAMPVKGPLLDEEALLKALDGPAVRAVAVSWVSFATGQRIDLDRLGKACKERGIYLIVDAMQGVGCSIFDVKACHADIVSVGGYKWLLSPWGTGFMYVKRDLIDTIEPPIVSWFVGPNSEKYDRLLNYDLTYFSDARRFEVMTLAAQDLIAMGSSLELHLELGLEAIEAHIRKLTDRLLDGLASCNDISVITPACPSKRSGIVTFAPPDAAAASKRLAEARIIHSLRENMIRLAPHFYNTAAEIDAVIDEFTRK